MRVYRRAAYACVLAGYVACAGAQAQVAANVPSYKSPTCNALCDLWTGITGSGTASAPDSVPPAAASAAPAPEDTVGSISRPARRWHGWRHYAYRRSWHYARSYGASRATRPQPVLAVASGNLEAGISADVVAAMTRHHIAAKLMPVSSPIVDLQATSADLAVIPGPLATGGNAHLVATVAEEELHLVAGASVASIADLRGKPVSLGLNGSASQVVTRGILKSLGIEVKEVPLEFVNAMDALRLGNVAAVAVLAPKPFADLNSLAAGSSFHLVAVPRAAAPASAGVGSLSKADYPALVAGEPVGTVAVGAALVAKEASRARELANQLRTVFATAGDVHLADSRPSR